MLLSQMKVSSVEDLPPMELPKIAELEGLEPYVEVPLKEFHKWPEVDQLKYCASRDYNFAFTRSSGPAEKEWLIFRAKKWLERAKRIESGEILANN